MEHSPERRREPRVLVDAEVWILGRTGLRRGQLCNASSASLGIGLRGPAPGRGTRVLVFLPTTRKLGWPAPLVARVVHRDAKLGVAFISIPRSTRPWLLRLIENARPAESSPCIGSDRAAERRDDRRLYEERLTALSNRTPHLLVARDVSSEGVRVDLLQWAEIGSELRISFPAPGVGPPIAVAARVARHDGARGTLLRFEDIAPDQREGIRRLLTLLHPLPDGRREGVALAEVA